MTYATETRAETSITKRLLRTTEIRTLRAITTNTLLDRKTNKEIREKCEIHREVDEEKKKGMEKPCE